MCSQKTFRRVVVSKSTGKPYLTERIGGKWFCDCPDFKYRAQLLPNFQCKHILKVKMDLGITE
jgi:predicted nucleic acid-binding Zn finger protein